MIRPILLPRRFSCLCYLTYARGLSTSSPSSTTTPFTTAKMPSPPLHYHSCTANIPLLDLSTLEKQFLAADTKRQAAYDFSRTFQVTLIRARRALEMNDRTLSVQERLQPFLDHEFLQQANVRSPRLANLSVRIEEYYKLLAYENFLNTGKLLPLPENTSSSKTVVCTDEEYLAGACIGLTQELQRYGLGRATVRDVDSVQAASDLVHAIVEFLLELDFRNGPLRRKYDGAKYCLKALENILYELAITSASSNDNDAGRAQKRIKTDKDLLLTDLSGLKQRMEERDALREMVIKRCRDGQKAAKQSIFAMHRGDGKQALRLLQDCHDVLLELTPTIELEPPLRNGSFSSVLEEYVEAKLFATWLYGLDLSNIEESSSSPTGELLTIEQFDMNLEPEDYIGGLCDLTGEIGRFAVQRGTARDVDGVRLCLQTNNDIWTGLQGMERGAGKKIEAARRSVEKLERMLYEMSLSEAAGGRHVHSDMDVDVKEESEELS